MTDGTQGPIPPFELEPVFELTAVWARMEYICEPINYEETALTIRRTGRGRYTLFAAHRHDGAKSYCANSERYDDLAWDELLDVLTATADGRRPGMHPQGWEQLDLWA